MSRSTLGGVLRNSRFLWESDSPRGDMAIGVDSTYKQGVCLRVGVCAVYVFRVYICVACVLLPVRHLRWCILGRVPARRH